jgi:hypothetical protein
MEEIRGWKDPQISRSVDVSWPEIGGFCGRRVRASADFADFTDFTDFLGRNLRNLRNLDLSWPEIGGLLRPSVKASADFAICGPFLAGNRWATAAVE